MILNDSIIRMRITVALTGMIIGSVMLRKICQRPAPSTIAASSVSRSRPSRPASRTMYMNGIHCQTSPMITAIRAPHGSPRTAKSSMPAARKTGANGPPSVSVSIRNMYAMPTGVMVSGSRNTTRKNRWPGSRWMVSIASPRPIRYCRLVPTMT